MKTICPDATIADSIDVGEKFCDLSLTVAKKRLKMNAATIRKLRSSDAYQVSLIKSPLQFLILMSISIFLMEVFVHTVFNHAGTKSLVDGVLLVIFLSPMLYYFLFLPLYTHIHQRKWAEEALSASDEELRILCSHLLVAQETERKRISTELHDDFGQALTFLKLRLKFIENRLAEDQIPLREECEENLRFIDQVINNIRRLSRDLSPSILEDLGLSASLNRLIEDFGKYHQCAEISAAMPDNIDNIFGTADQILIYRIFQEGLTNISRHSQARNVTVYATQDAGSVQFSIEDDGRGFDLQKVTKGGSASSSLGIVTLQQRVRTLGGSLSIESRIGVGTKLLFTIPINKRR